MLMNTSPLAEFQTIATYALYSGCNFEKNHIKNSRRCHSSHKAALLAIKHRVHLRGCNGTTLKCVCRFLFFFPWWLMWTDVWKMLYSAFPERRNTPPKEQYLWELIYVCVYMWVGQEMMGGVFTVFANSSVNFIHFPVWLKWCVQACLQPTDTSLSHHHLHNESSVWSTVGLWCRVCG